MISVIVPVYNAEKYIAECIQSVLSQDYKDYELILINDGSQDNSLEICNQFKAPNIIIIDKPNGGVSSARNAGLKIAKGEYITFIDSDDTIPVDSLSTLINVINDKDVDLVVGAHTFNYEGNYQPHKPRLKEGLYNTMDLLPKFIDDGTLSGFLLGSVCGSLYKIDIINRYNITFNERIKYNEDGLFNFEYSLRAQKIYQSNSATYFYRKYSDSSSSTRPITTNINSYLKEYIYNIKHNIKSLDLDNQFLKREVSLALWDILKFTSSMNFRAGCEYISNKINHTDFTSGLKLISPKRIPIHKRVFYYLMKYKCTNTLYIVVKYILPYCYKHIKR